MSERKDKAAVSIFFFYEAIVREVTLIWLHINMVTLIYSLSGPVISHLKTGASPGAAKPVSKTVCKFHPKCTKMDCQYLHPRVSFNQLSVFVSNFTLFLYFYLLNLYSSMY